LAKRNPSSISSYATHEDLHTARLIPSGEDNWIQMRFTGKPVLGATLTENIPT
jgi:hypothetical protein